MIRRFNWIVVLGLAATLLGFSTTISLAAETWPAADAAVAAARKYFFHLGFAVVPYDEGSSTTIAGNPSPTSGMRLDPNYTVSTEGGYYLTPNFAVAFSGGYPPTETSWGAGDIASLGPLGKTTAGIVTLNAQYHVTNFGRFMPYAGAGPAYMIVFKTDDGALTNFHVDNALGFNFQIGADWMLSDRFGVFVDVKKVFMTTTSSGLRVGTGAVNSTIRLDPTIYSVGLTVRY